MTIFHLLGFHIPQVFSRQFAPFKTIPLRPPGILSPVHKQAFQGRRRGLPHKGRSNGRKNPDLEAWVSQVRDVAYDAEDILDEFILRFGRRYADGFLGRVRKLYGSIKNLKTRHQVATRLRTIKCRIRNISEAHQRYQNRYSISDQSSTCAILGNKWYDSRGDALLLEEADLVGIERPKKKLMSMLFTNDSQLRVISVVGMGGLGKTTLVKRVYDDVATQNRFKHHAWITVSQSFKMETLLMQVIRQLFKEFNQSSPHEFDIMDINSMKKFVHHLLRQENYILVFDDNWSPIDWDAIRMAFPKNNCGSRILITTRITEVGQAATSDNRGDIYFLEPLTKSESRTLFCTKVFWNTCCPRHLEEISENIIEKCAGLPLPIVVIGGVLATKSRRTEEWDLFNRSLGEQLARNSQLDNMTKLLWLSYYDLPDHLKVCFLYFGILPEDAFIEERRLIRLWIAEGFVQNKQGMTLEEVAESYLNELINRSLVQVAIPHVDGRVKSCRIHDIIRQIILRKSRDHNITTIFSEQEMQLSNKIRRLVIHSYIENTQVSNGIFKCLRSLILFESTGSMSKPLIPSKLLSDDLRLLKVLELKGTPLEAIPDEIFKFLRLKYLSLRNTRVKTVPKSIGRLSRLETLDLKKTNVQELPVEILKLQQLRHLLVCEKHNGFQAPCKIGQLQSLQSLCNTNADKTGDIKLVKEIGKLTQLRKLGITKLRREDGKELCSSLEKLTNLRSLRVVSVNQEEVIDLQYSLSSTPRFLRWLDMRGRLEKVPQWISSLQGLSKIKLFSSRLRDDPLQLLQDLPNLVEIMFSQAYQGEELCFKAGGFQGLKRIWLWGFHKLRCVRVEKGAMPSLQRLQIGECNSLVELPTGIQHLINLQHLSFVNMPASFVNVLEDMDKQSADYKKIAHIPQVVITYWVDGEFKRRYL